MGMDKETVDLWIFGRPRPDLTPAQTFAASPNERGEITGEEAKRHDALIAEHHAKRMAEIADGLPKTKAEMEEWHRRFRRSDAGSARPA